MSTVLRGLKRHLRCRSGDGSHFPEAERPWISDLTAIVAVTDDGGSSGLLRHEFGMLPPGDLRNCIVALADDEHLLAPIIAHRFRSGGALCGHSVGNLLIAALTEMTGDFAQAVKMASEVLALQGRILPATAADVTMAALVEDGSIVRGETNITASHEPIVEVMLEPRSPEPQPEALEAIANADLIVVGPGSLYTSLITNLLVRGIPEALAGAHATRVYIANLMTEANESLGLSVVEHIERIYEHAGRPIFDYALVNTGAISANVRERYAAEGAEPTQADIQRIEAMGISCFTGDFVAEGDVLRHAADRVAEALVTLPCAQRSLGAERTRHVGEQILEVNSPRLLRNRGAATIHSDAA